MRPVFWAANLAPPARVGLFFVLRARAFVPALSDRLKQIGTYLEAIQKLAVIPKPSSKGTFPLRGIETFGAKAEESAFCLVQKQIPREVYPRRGTRNDIF